ncbi:MAG: AAA family ATPase [Candidatus Competibacteraceae bacterium]|nr:AAA family ATPase [Candidatus Competibacteraceae bacterium]
MTEAGSKLSALSEAELGDLVAALLELEGYLIRRPGSASDFIAYAPDNSVTLVEVSRDVPSDDHIAQVVEFSEPERIYSLLFVASHPWPASTRDWEDRGDVLIRLWGPEELTKQLEAQPELAVRFGLANIDRRPFVYRLSRLHLVNVRGFEDFSLEFETGTNTIFIGRNGTGKSTLLRIIALALAPPSDIPALLAHRSGVSYARASPKPASRPGMWTKTTAFTRARTRFAAMVLAISQVLLVALCVGMASAERQPRGPSQAPIKHATRSRHCSTTTLISSTQSSCSGA